jgi:hypothetical protein
VRETTEPSLSQSTTRGTVGSPPHAEQALGKHHCGNGSVAIFVSLRVCAARLEQFTLA